MQKLHVHDIFLLFQAQTNFHQIPDRLTAKINFETLSRCKPGDHPVISQLHIPPF